VSKSSAKRVSFLRQSAWINDTILKNRTLHIIGCGAVGSNTALIAARMGWTKFKLWDNDIVENHNLPNQAYALRHIGMNKVDALKELLKEFNSYIEVETFARKFTSTEDTENIADTVIVSTDSMSSRMDIYEAIHNSDKINLVLDTRLAFDYAELYAFDPSIIANLYAWKDTLRDDSEIPDGPCNLRLCTTLVQVVGSTAVHYSCVPHAVWRGARVRAFPFKTLYMLSDRLVVKSIYSK
jgi:sulfur carrier protein ThiS adenylyltransferase